MPRLVVIFIHEPDFAVHRKLPETICVLSTVDVRANMGHFTTRIQLVGDGDILGVIFLLKSENPAMQFLA